MKVYIDIYVCFKICSCSLKKNPLKNQLFGRSKTHSRSFLIQKIKKYFCDKPTPILSDDKCKLFFIDYTRFVLFHAPFYLDFKMFIIWFIRGDTHRHTYTGHFEISTESFGNVNRLIGPPLLQSKTFCRNKKKNLHKIKKNFFKKQRIVHFLRTENNIICHNFGQIKGVQSDF